MKIIIIGSVAAGTSVAAKARRNREDVEIVIYEKDKDISYSGCGLPYYIGQDYITRDNLTPRNPDWFKKRFNLDIKTKHEVVAVDHKNKKIEILNIETGDKFSDNYDKLIFATGASPVLPPIQNIENDFIFTLRNVSHADKLYKFIETEKPDKAVIVGAGYIGLELAENLIERGIDVSIMELSKLPMSNLDEDVSVHIRKELEQNNIRFIGGEKLTAIEQKDNQKFVLLESGERIETDFVVLATGVKPVSELAKSIGVKTANNNAIIVDKYLQTNLNDVYAVGDCAMAFSSIDSSPMWVPLGSTANKMGRVCGDHITGGKLSFQGILGTGIFKVCDLAVATTGLTERQVQRSGIEYIVHHNFKPNQTEYFNTSSEMMIKMIAEKSSGKILGAQIVGKNGVDKRIDVIATAISFGATVEQLFHLDLAYAPPFSTTKDPVHYSGMVLNNAKNNDNPIITPQEVLDNPGKYIIIDVRSNSQYNEGHIPNAINIPLAEIRNRANEISKNKELVVHCNKGVSGNAAQNVLLNLGFERVYNLSGGYKNYKLISEI
ncbi:MAG: FAD-dependent oxidoreductase [Marinifilaceae bacterium]|jgi:NADPH-dependent 2,4-dienoyl-CoA reductase/sulfur reductase-like enzyme/rhodanese-related sulfurtransferase|nr:FAD-dependent oxidoreductase [Marinifilaceae bacterium]